MMDKENHDYNSTNTASRASSFNSIGYRTRDNFMRSKIKNKQVQECLLNKSK